jgi:hypothetical protein
VRTSSDDITFEQLVVGEQFQMESASLIVTLDYKDNKDNEDNENSDNLEPRDQPIQLSVEGTKIDAGNAENLFLAREKK